MNTPDTGALTGAPFIASEDCEGVRHRASDAELSDRERDALELLAAGLGTAMAAQTLAGRYGVSLRQSQRYVRVAALELLEPLTGHELDIQAGQALYRLDLIAGRAMAAGDTGAAIRATRAHGALLAQLRRAIEPPAGPRSRIRLARSTIGVPPPPF
jgi:hypothetical protein